MNFKPSDFFLGIVDFLGILVPGAALVYLESEWISRIFGVSPLQAHWLVFAASAYFVGQLLLALTEGFNLLAEPIMDKIPVLKGTQVHAKRFGTTCASLLGDAASQDAAGITFHAALSFVRLNSAEAAAEVDRHMAGYKLLRNLTAVFLLDFFISLSKGLPRIASDFVLVVVLFLAFTRMLQWAQLLAFQYCILIREQKSGAQPAEKAPSTSHTSRT